MASTPTSPPPDLGPSTSYSDPFYDRLDVISQRVKRQWFLIVLVLIAFIAVGVWWSWSAAQRPLARDGGRYDVANSAKDRIKALTDFAADPSVAPVFAVKAATDVTQLHLDAGHADLAKGPAERALAVATAAADPELIAVAQLNLAAVHADAGRLPEAEKLYRQVEKQSSGAPDRRLLAILQQALLQERDGRIEEALITLEPMLTRTPDRGGEVVLNTIITHYWYLKRKQSLAPGSATTSTSVINGAVAPAAPTATGAAH